MFKYQLKENDYIKKEKIKVRTSDIMKISVKKKYYDKKLNH